MSYAALLAGPDLLQELLDRGGADAQKGEVLQYALDRKTDDVVPVLGMLLDKGAPIDAIEYDSHPGSFCIHYWMPRGTPLYKAARLGNTEAVRFLLGRGADAKIPNTKGQTALERAQQGGFTDIVKLLTRKELEVQGKEPEIQGKEPEIQRKEPGIQGDSRS